MATVAARSRFDLGLYRCWIVANGLSELVGLGATGLLAWRVVGSAGESSSAVAVFGTALLAVASGAILEGVPVGYAQARALRLRLPAFPVARWILATTVGAAVAWALGMIPSSMMALAGPSAGGPPPTWLEGPMQYLLAAGMGLVLGPLLGIPQSLVLRQHTQRPFWWILANALAWAIGMPIVFLGASHVPTHGGPVLLISILAVTCLTTGLAVGAVHGLVLVELLAAPRAET